MGIKSFINKRFQKTTRLLRLYNTYKDYLVYRIAILSLLAVAIITIILKLWLVSLLMVIIDLLAIIYSWYKLKRSIDRNRKEIYELKKLITNKDQYISDFSHRIRTPLSNLPLINDLLSTIEVNIKQKELMEALISSTNNMIAALNELTIRSAGEVSIEPRKNIRFDLEKTIDSTIELLGIERADNILLDISWDNRIKKDYIGDPMAIQQIFIGYFSLWSSKPETEQMNVNIYVKSKFRSETGDTIECIIETQTIATDTYISIDQKAIDNSLPGKLVRLMGGGYLFKTLGNHTLFSFTMPLENVTEEERIDEVDEKIRKLDTFIRQKKKLSDARILLVEDNISNQKIVSISMGSKVKRIDTAVNGKQALDMYNKSNYDIILMDIRLPVMDGITVSKRIREVETGTTKHTPIIATTANAMLGDKEKCLSAGMDDYLSKPFQPQKLLEMLNKHITGSMDS